MARNGRFVGIKKKSKAQQRKIRAAYMRARRAKARKEQNTANRAYENAKKDLLHRALQLDKVSNKGGDQLRSAFASMEKRMFNDPKFIADKHKEPVLKKVTNNTYNALAVWAKDALANNTNYNVNVAKNKTTVSAALIAHIPTYRSRTGKVRADLSNASNEQKKKYYNARRSVINGRQGMFNNVRLTFYDIYGKRYSDFASDQIVDSVQYVLDRNDYDNNNQGWSQAASEAEERLDWMNKNR